MSSNSELQRISLLAEDKLNLPACLPDLYVSMNNPSPCRGGVGKKILDALFTSGPVVVDREQLCECNPGSQYDNARTCVVFVASVMLGNTQLDQGSILV